MNKNSLKIQIYTNILLVFALFFIQNTNIFAQKDPKAKTILDATKKRYQAIDAFKATFVYTMDSKNAGVSESLSGEITIKNGKFYLKTPKQHIITDKTTQWTYLQASNEVNITNYEPDPNDITPEKIYTIYENGYDYSYMEEKVEQGKKYHIIDLKPLNKDAQFFKIRLKIVQETNSIKSWELFERNSNRYLYTVTKFASVNVGDSYFKYNPSKYSSKPTQNDLR
jgi:outer membrane lipoprotein carrier protein